MVTRRVFCDGLKIEREFEVLLLTRIEMPSEKKIQPIGVKKGPPGGIASSHLVTSHKR